jgi:AcrR family transcriptional regulator
MTRTRLPANERKAVILANARAVFAQSGYEAARTQEIARRSGVSEALMYRHFPSKEALYRAVLREVIHEQNQSYELLALSELNGRELVRNLRTYFKIVVGRDEPGVKEGFRLLLASITSDANFAKLVYRRAHRLMNDRIAQALQTAREAGDIHGRLLSVRNTSLFSEHIGSILNVLAGELERTPYEGDTEEIVRDAVWFCCRAVGFTDQAIERHLQD